MNIYESACKLFPDPIARLNALSLVNAARIDERQKIVANIDDLRKNIDPKLFGYGCDPDVVQQHVLQCAIDRMKGLLKA